MLYWDQGAWDGRSPAGRRAGGRLRGKAVDLNGNRLLKVAVLVTFLVMGAGAVLGTLALRGRSTALSVERGEWPMEGGEPARRAWLERGPERPLQESWVQRLKDRLDAPPAVAGGRVFVGDRDGNLYCLDAATGLPRWEFDAGSEITATPAVSEEMVFVGTGSGVVLAVGVDGRVRWRRELGDAVSASVLPTGDRVYAASRDRFLYALDRENGTVVWKHEMQGPLEVAPTVGEGHVFVPCGDGLLYALKERDGELDWCFDSRGYFRFPAAVHEGRVYLCSEFELFCLDVQTGMEHWKQPSGSVYYRSNLCVRGSQVIVCQGSGSGEGGGNTLVAFEARTGDSLWNRAVGGADRTAITATDKEVYVGTDEGIFSYEVGSGALRLDQRLRGILPYTLTVTSDALYTTTENFRVHCFRHI